MHLMDTWFQSQPSLYACTAERDLGAQPPARTVLGSMVQKGKFSAGTVSLVRQLKRVLLPTLGRPTMPICTPGTVSYVHTPKWMSPHN